MKRPKVRLPYVVLAMLTVAGSSWAGLESASGAETTIDASSPYLVPGRSTTVIWDNIVSPTKTGGPTPKDWIGLYSPSNAPDTEFIAWRYTDSTLASGSEPFFVPPDAPRSLSYQFRLFSNDSFARLAFSPILGVATDLSFQRPSVGRGTSQFAQWRGVPATPKDWIGLYPSSTTPDSAFIAWRYTDSTSTEGGEPLTVPANAVVGHDYWIRLFANDTFSRLATSGPFGVT